MSDPAEKEELMQAPATVHGRARARLENMQNYEVLEWDPKWPMMVIWKPRMGGTLGTWEREGKGPWYVRIR